MSPAPGGRGVTPVESTWRQTNEALQPLAVEGWHRVPETRDSPVGRKERAHIVVGPGGIAVLTCRHAGARGLLGMPPSDAILAETSTIAGRVAACLPPSMRLHVVPILCLPATLLRADPVPGPIGDVTVCTVPTLTQVLRARPAILTEPTMLSITAVLGGPVPPPMRRHPSHVIPTGLSGVDPRARKQFGRLLALLIVVLFIAGGGVGGVRNWVAGWTANPHPAVTGAPTGGAGESYARMTRLAARSLE